jgi:guanylate kinase
MRNIIIISAPSGTGKTTLCKAIQEKIVDIQWSVSFTTRKKRAIEIDGIDYKFISEKNFKKLIAENKFSEWEKVHGNYYGTSKTSLNNAIEENKILLLELDVKGAMKLKQSYPENSYSIFIIPPSIDHLRARLKKRGTDSDERIEVRLQRFEEEMNLKENFDQIMINEDLESAKLQLTNIINKVKEGD